MSLQAQSVEHGPDMLQVSDSSPALAINFFFDCVWLYHCPNITHGKSTLTELPHRFKHRNLGQVVPESTRRVNSPRSTVPYIKYPPRLVSRSFDKSTMVVHYGLVKCFNHHTCNSMCFLIQDWINYQMVICYANNENNKKK